MFERIRSSRQLEEVRLSGSVSDKRFPFLEQLLKICKSCYGFVAGPTHVYFDPLPLYFHCEFYINITFFITIISPFAPFHWNSNKIPSLMWLIGTNINFAIIFVKFTYNVQCKCVDGLIFLERISLLAIITKIWLPK